MQKNTPNPLVAFLPNVKTAAWHGAGQVDVRTCPLLPILEAITFNDGWGGGSCIQPIVDHGFDGEQPRLGSGAMAAYVHGARTATLNAVLFDLDYNGHTEPPAGWAQEVSDNIPLAHGWYRSPNGMRVVFLPEYQVPAQYARSYMIWLSRQVTLPFLDETSLQPFRLQYTQYALDRDLPSDLSGLAPLSVHPAEGELELETHIRGVQVKAGKTPDVTGLRKMSAAELKVIKDTDLRARIKSGLVRARVGERHATLLEMARQLSAYIDDPVTVFRWLLPSAETLFRKELDTRDWRGELWRMIAWAMAATLVAEEELEEVKEAALEDSAIAQDVTRAQMMRRVVLAHDKGYWVWDEVKCQYVGPIGDKAQIQMLLRAHAPSLTCERKSGWDYATLLSVYGARVNEVAYTYDPLQEGLENGVFTVRETHQVQVAPRYHAGVHEWLVALGGDCPERFLDWLACYPLINRPVCALYIQGAPGIGKGLLGAGLAQVFESNEYLKYDQLSSFMGQLRRSPLVWADETMGDTDSGLLRQLVGNGRHVVREMYKPHYTLHGFPRLLITANNSDLLHLSDNPTKTDLDAVRQRVGYLEAGSAARRTLKSLARRNDDQKMLDMTTEWLENNHIAAHILYLCENRDVTPGDRFLVEGWESAMTKRLSISYVDAERVMITLIAAVMAQTTDEGVRYKDGEVLVQAAALAQIWEDVNNSKADRPLETRAIARALKQIAGEESRRVRMDDGSRPRFWVIQGERLITYCEESGIGDDEHLTALINRSEDDIKKRPAFMS